MNWQSELEKLCADNLSGSSALARKSGELLRSFARQECRHSGLEVSKSFQSLAERLIRRFPEMASVEALLDQVALRLETKGGNSAFDLTRLVATEVSQFFRKQEIALAAIAEKAAAFFTKQVIVVTLSASMAVERMLIHLHAEGKLAGLFVLESRPLGEGMLLAKRLAERGISVTAAVDAALDRVLEKADVALVGADCIDGQVVVNKIGTKLLALAARAQAKPCYVAADTSKFGAGLLTSTSETQGQPDEVAGDLPAKVAVYNPYFEPTPLAWFTGIFSEQGLLTLLQVGEVCARRPQSGFVTALRQMK